MKNFFDTSHLSGNLAQKTARGGFAVGITRISSFVLSLGSTAVLARLLCPEDFGIVAMVMAVLGFVLVFREMGLSMATVQRKDVTHEQVSNLFWINCAFGVLIAFAILAISPLIGTFYNDSRLPPVAALLSLTVLFSSLTVQHEAIARRHLKFWHVQASVLGGHIFGIAAAIIMALNGFGYWALVWKNVINPAGTCLIIWTVVSWRPSLPRRGTGVRSMISFGLHISASRFMRKAKSLVDNILIGYFAGPASLGFYTKAFSLLMLPVNQINYPVSSVSFPALSRLQDDSERFQKVYYQGIALLASLTMPTIAFLVIACDDLIPLFLGQGWQGTIILFQALAAAAFIQALDLTKGWATIPFGRGKRIMLCNTIDSIFTIVAICIGIYWGALGVAVALSLSALIKFIPLNLYAFHNSPITLSGLFFNSLMLPLLFCIISSTFTLIFKISYDSESHWLSFIFQAIIFGTTYTIIPWFIPGGKNLFVPAQNSLRLMFKN
ncbi:MAG: lipopolysaccharide biosynthesis protein [Desulfobacteraceae bacterium]|nr:lipopolysaccharide biosynthesis protein [Desulfobacteraceae bacterium]